MTDRPESVFIQGRMRPVLPGRAGYSLVEVCLALLVVAVGLLAVFGLFPEGLNASRRAVDTTEISAFADFVFASLEIEASATNAVWADFKSGNNNGLKLMRSHSLKNAMGGQIVVEAKGANNPTTFYWTPDYYADLNKEYVEEVVTVSSFTYTLDIGAAPGGGNGKYARLKVWPGEYPSGTMPPGKGMVFYREYIPTKLAE